MRIAPIITVFALAVGLPSAAAAQTVSGAATAIDGDTLELAGMRFDIAGIDAPELEQTCTRNAESWACGAEAKAMLATFVEGYEISCETQTVGPDGTTRGSCRRGTLDLGLVMVESGLAIALEHAPFGYSEAQAIREQYRMGLWSGEFEPPAAWRLANPAKVAKTAPAARSRPVAPAEPQPEKVWRNKWGCAIKGNKSWRGEWIYHLPGRPYYNQTKAEALFCTESEARAAGYRRSKA